MKKLKELPIFKDEQEESAFWDINDTTDYLDMSKAKKVRFSNLKKTTKSISLIFPISDKIEKSKVMNI